MARVGARAYGYEFPPLATRFEMLDESLTIARGLLTQERTTFTGRHFRVENASCLPLPVQERLPIWVGGIGEKKTLRLAARHADGWNAAYASPAEFARLSGVLDEWCEKEGRDPRTISRAINLAFHLATDAKGVAKHEADIRRQWGPAAERMIPGALLGTPDRAREILASYFDAGADLVTVALRAPWEPEALDAYLEEVVPKAR